MKNILTIFKGDLRKLRRNIIAWAIILGIVCVPSFYSWFNLAASWDPYGRTDQIKIALATDDLGYDGDAFPVSVNLGDNLVARVASTEKYDWVITDSDDAVEGTRNGTYYAAVVVPESFSADIMSIFSKNVHHSELTYYSNEKENAIAPKLIGKEVDGIQQEVAGAVTESILELALNTAESVTSPDNQKSASRLMGNLSVSMDHVKTIISNTQGTLASLSDAAASMESLLKSMEDFSAGLDQVSDNGQDLSKEMSRKLSELIKKADGDIAVLDSYIKELQDLSSDPFIDDIVGRIETVNNDIKDIKKDIKSVKSSMNRTAGDVDKAAENIADTSAAARKVLRSLQSSLDDTQPLLSDAYAKIDSLQKEVQAAADKGDITLLRNLFSQDTSDLSAFLVSPVNINRISMYHVENNGAAMMPFYTSLSLWIGAIILVALIKTTLEEERRRELDNLRLSQEYLGRYLIFVCLGLTQTLIVCFGDLFYLGLQCEHPVKFVFAALFTSLVFVLFVYTLTVSFSNVGKAIAVVLLVIQVAGSGGVLAIEMTPAFFQKVYPLLPFRYSMSAMREAIAGTYGNTYWMSLLCLCAFIAFALLLGLVLRRPLIRMNEFIHERLEDTKLM